MATPPPALDERADAYFHDARQSLFRRTDRLFGWLMPVQWVVAVAVAATISPKTWAGAESAPHRNRPRVSAGESRCSQRPRRHRRRLK